MPCCRPARCPKSRCGPVARAPGCWPGARRGTWSTTSPYGELALVCPDGQIVHPLDWQCEQPVPLLKNVLRLTAPNPGAMTGPGTNSYLVGDPAHRLHRHRPRPGRRRAPGKTVARGGGNIRMIVCTHSHPDHAPGARPLQAMCASHRRFWACRVPAARATARLCRTGCCRMARCQRPTTCPITSKVRSTGSASRTVDACGGRPERHVDHTRCR